jgi:hypothetical protein
VRTRLTMAADTDGAIEGGSRSRTWRRSVFLAVAESGIATCKEGFRTAWIGGMQCRWQAGMIAGCAVALCAAAAEKDVKLEFKPPVVGKGLFDDKLVMLDRERGEYATNLASYAANQIATSRGSKESLEGARRYLGLAMHLSPRNQKALVVNHQLSRGILPDPTDGIYTAGVFSRLLLTRGQLLMREGGRQDVLLARMFIELATEMDPRNEDAVYAFELQRIDQGDFDWSIITDYKEPAPKPPAPEPPPAEVAPAAGTTPEAPPAAKPDEKAEAKPAPPNPGRPGGPPGGPPGKRGPG